jgi:hypothetical protein
MNVRLRHDYTDRIHLSPRKPKFWCARPNPRNTPTCTIDLSLPSRTMPPAPIPDEQLKRIQPSVDDLLAQLRALANGMPSNTESALVFELDREDSE